MDKTPPKSETTTDQLQHLRDLLVGPTADSVQDLRKELNERSVSEDEIGELLPQAINKSSKKKLARALGPTLSDAFQDSIKRDPRSLVDAISPIMGPAIRRSISQQIQAMVQSLNTALDHSLSPKGIRWRIEAWRTGKPFAEVVLLHTLLYRIEQLLLIDPNTGLMMQSVSADPGNEDADLVSSLLAAIQGFTRDSFEHNTDGGADLRVMRTNELSVLIEHGPKAILAAAVRGEIPVKFRTRMQAAAEQLHLQHGPLLEKFDGDTSPLEPIRVDLEELLESEYVDKKEEPKTPKADPTWAKHLGWAIPAALLFIALAWGLSAQRAKRQQRLESVLDLPPTAQLKVSESVLHLHGSARHEWLAQAKNRMERLPDFQLNESELVISDQNWVSFLNDLRGRLGIIVVNAYRDSDHYVLQGWRDPLAVAPSELLKKYSVNEEVQQTWEPYRSLDPRLTIERLKSRVEYFPKDVALEPHEDTGWLYLRGEAPKDWVLKLRRTIEDAELGHAVNISQLQVIGGRVD